MPNCTFCRSAFMIEVLDFGNMALAGAFLKKSQIVTEKKYKMRLYICQKCKSLQIIDKIKPKVLFDNYFYYSSKIKTLKNHFNNYSKFLSKLITKFNFRSVLEIGCNDYVLLDPLSKKNIGLLIGVDPSINKKNSSILGIKDYFNYSMSKKIREKFKSIDLIIANNVFAHIYNINDLTKGIRNILSTNGMFILEVHYMKSIIKYNQFDMIYHEHIYYYSITSLFNHFKKHDLYLFDIQHINTHGGSIRAFVSKNLDSNSKLDSYKKVLNLITQEKKQKLFTSQTLKKFKINTLSITNKLKKFLQSEILKNKIFAAYGASGRANTFMQFCGFNNKLIKFIIDDSSYKQGYFTPGTHIPIVSREFLKKNHPDYIIIFAWTFLSEIIKKNIPYLMNNGTFIIPLPNTKLVTKRNFTKYLV